MDQSDFYYARTIERSPVSKPPGDTIATHQPTTATVVADGSITVESFGEVESVKRTKAAPTNVESKKPAKKIAEHKEGVFSPVVYAAKDVLGEERLNKLRGEVIALHSDVIKGFVATADSKIGQAVLRQLFTLTDKNQDGKIEIDELRAALKALRFEWLNDKQVNGIFERADVDRNGDIDMNEWMQEAPKTLKTNLVKLAKNNGGKMGLLV